MDFLQSSRLGDQTEYTLNNVPVGLDSIAESFHSPPDKGLLGGKGARKNAASRTPLLDRQLPNKQTSFGRPEFTPLLKSAARNNARRGLSDDQDFTSSSWRQLRLDGNGAAQLPTNGSGGGTETYDSEEFQNTINGPPPMASSSVISTPAAGNGNKS